MAGLYLHIPFCKRICAYCDFVHTADLRSMDPVLDAMAAEIDRRRNFLNDKELRTVYIGGGTPSTVSPPRLRQLVDLAARHFDTVAVGEFTVEANPDDIDDRYLRLLRRAGVNRLSLGVQSFDDDCLRLMNRRHTAAAAADAVRRAQDAGFDNLSVDLIFGIDGFGMPVLERSVDTLTRLGVQHVSAYHLTVENGTAFGRMVARGEMKIVGEETSEAEYMFVHDALAAAGFEHYEVSNYALPGFRAQHNSSYWDGTEYLGIGPGAHSFNGRTRWWNAPTVAQYLAGTGSGSEEPSPAERLNETIMTALRTADGLDMSMLAVRYGERAAAGVMRRARRFADSGTLVSEEGRLRIPPRKFMVSDYVIASLFEDE